MSLSAAPSVSTGEGIKPETIDNGDDSSSSCSEGGGGGSGGGALVKSEESPPAAAETQPKSSGSQKKRSPQPKGSKPAVDPKKRKKRQPAAEPLERNFSPFADDPIADARADDSAGCPQDAMAVEELAAAAAEDDAEEDDEEEGGRVMIVIPAGIKPGDTILSDLPGGIPIVARSVPFNRFPTAFPALPLPLPPFTSVSLARCSLLLRLI